MNETNDFPEFTGRICPALCEKSCVLKLSMDSPVTTRENEAAIAETAFREGYIKPRNIERNGRKVAIIGARARRTGRRQPAQRKRVHSDRLRQE